METAPMRTLLLKTSFLRVRRRKIPVTAAPIRFLAPLMASADQGISLIKSPPVLKQTDARNTNSVERILVLSVISGFIIFFFLPS